MKKIIAFGFVFLLLISSVLAYGGGGVGGVLPLPIFQKYIKWGSDKTPSDVWLVNSFNEGSNRHKIDKEGIPVKEIDVVFTKKTNAKGSFEIIAKKDVKNAITAFEIHSNANENANFDHADVYFEVPTAWAEKQSEVRVIKTSDDGSEFTTFGEFVNYLPDGKSLYKITIDSFSEFVVTSIDDMIANLQPSSSAESPKEELKSFPIAFEDVGETQVVSDEKFATELTEPALPKESHRAGWIALAVLIVLVAGGLYLENRYKKKQKPQEPAGEKVE